MKKEVLDQSLIREAYAKIYENAPPVEIDHNAYKYYDDDYKILGTSYIVAANFEYAPEVTGHQAGYHGGAVRGRDVYHNMAQSVSQLMVLDDKVRPVTNGKLLDEISGHVLEKQREEDMESPGDYGDLE